MTNRKHVDAGKSWSCLGFCLSLLRCRKWRKADWTEGCIAVASDEAINEIAAWVQDKKPDRVYLVGD